MSKSTAVVNQTINAAVSASDPATTPRKRAKQLARRAPVPVAAYDARHIAKILLAAH
jgi:hypothetical protein